MAIWQLIPSFPFMHTTMENFVRGTHPPCASWRMKSILPTTPGSVEPVCWGDIAGHIWWGISIQIHTYKEDTYVDWPLFQAVLSKAFLVASEITTCDQIRETNASVPEFL